MDNKPKLSNPTNNELDKAKAFELKMDKTRFYADILKNMIRKVLPENAEFLLDDLEKVVYERLTAEESRDFETSASLEPKEKALIDQIVKLILRLKTK